MLGLFVVLMLAGPARAQALHFPKPAVDWGSIKRGQVLVQRFPYVNNTNQPITITATKSSCGCLTSKLSQRVIEPGKSGHIDVEVNTLTQPAGPNAWKTTLTCESGQRVIEIHLYIEANLQAELAIEPAGLTLYANKPIKHVIKLTDHREQPLKIDAVRGSRPELKAMLLSSERDAQGRVVHAIQVQVAEDFPAGRHDELVSIYTNDQEYRELRVPVSVKMEAGQQLSITPERVVIPVLERQGKPSKLVLLRDSEGRPVKIDQVVSEHPTVQCRWASAPGGSVTLRVEVDATQVGTQNIKAVLKVHVTSPVQQVIHIPVECPVTP
jgi:hypothetical protein